MLDNFLFYQLIPYEIYEQEDILFTLYITIFHVTVGN